MVNKKNVINVSVPSSTVGLQISTTNTKQVIDATNNRAQYFADLAKKYRDEAKQHRDNAKFYAEQNSDVTFEYIDNVKLQLESKINSKQDLGNYALKEELPVNVSELKNDLDYVVETELVNAIDEIRLPEQIGCEGKVLVSNGTYESWVDIQALTKYQITNCLLEAPQNIKLELNNGTLTLKAGSKVIVPNGKNADGSNKFDEVVIESDITRSSFGSSSNQCLVMMLYSNGKITSFSYAYSNIVSSGTTPPVSGNFYNTSTNYLNSYNASVAVDQRAFPIGLITLNAGVPISIDEVFNGMGTFGSIGWCDKDVKVSIPNGRNEDGTLNNLEIKTTSVSTYTIPNANREIIVFLGQNGKISMWGSDNGNVRQYKTRPAVPEKNYVKAYIEDENVWWYAANQGVWTEKQYITPLFKIRTDADKKAISYDFKLPFRAVDYNDFSNTPHITQTYVNGTSWYRLWSDGWCEQGGQVTGVVYNSTTQNLTFLKPFKDTNYFTSAIPIEGAHAGDTAWVCNKKTTGMIVKTGFQAGSATLAANWRACGYIA